VTAAAAAEPKTCLEHACFKGRLKFAACLQRDAAAAVGPAFPALSVGFLDVSAVEVVPRLNNEICFS
jgi:hypothetical protein